MSTRSTARNLFPPLDNPEFTIQRRSHADPTPLNNFEMATEGNGDPPVLDLRTMKELCQPSLNGRVTPNCETCGGPHSYNDCPATVGQTQNVYAAGAYQGFNQNQNRNSQNQNFQNQNRNHGIPQGNNQGRNQFFQGASHGPNPPLAYQAPAYQALSYRASVHQPPIPRPQVMTTTEFTNYMKANDSILKNMQTNMTSLTNSNLELKNMFGQFMKMNTDSSSGSGTLPSNTITNLKEDLKGITTRSRTAYQGPMIPTTSSSLLQVVELETEAKKDTVPPTNNGSTKDVQPPVVQVESPILNSKPVVAPIIEPVAAPVSALKPNPKPSIPYPIRLHDQKLQFGLTIKTLLTNKDKLYELARTPLNKHCSTVLLKKLPEKLGDPGKFLIPCDFSGMDECLALADLDASINLMPLSVWNKLSHPELSTTCMTLKLVDCLIFRPVGVAKDVFVKVGTFYFPSDFVVVDFDVDPRVPLIFKRSFIKTKKALIDVFERELTLRVGKEAITFNLDQTSRYSANYNDMTVNRIDVIDMACEEYSQEVLGFFNLLKMMQLHWKLITLISTRRGDILLFEAFLNDDPSLPPPTQGNYLPQVRKELKIYEAKNDKSSIDEPPEVELKDLPPHLKYTFLEGDDKLPVIIVKDLSDEEKTALIMVLKSHNHWVSPVHCVPKKGDFTVVENEENESILTRLVTEWRVCIDYRPFLSSRGNKYILVAVDYLSKWVKAKVLPTNDARVVCKFLKSLFARFGTPRAIISDRAYENSLIYKEETKRLHDSNIKDRIFNVDDRVLLFNSRLKIFSGKLKTRWSGPFIITQVFPYGTVELSQTGGPNFKVNGDRLKHYFGEDIPKMVVADL
nr:hypothetical protein [Tanacetum cinerariifolium]